MILTMLGNADTRFPAGSGRSLPDIRVDPRIRM
jgi:hypothetical protein